MRLGAWGLVLAGLVLAAVPADAAISLSVALKNYYAEYEIVQQCARRSQLTGEDVETAGAAMSKIEKHYFGRDEKLNKKRLQKQAADDKNDSFKIFSHVAALRACGLIARCRSMSSCARHRKSLQSMARNRSRQRARRVAAGDYWVVAAPPANAVCFR